jgi:cell division protein FtsI (penicillin-binding protein 3)
LPVTLVKRTEPEAGAPIITPQTARSLRKMLELAVQPGGTAPRAQVPGYRVAGKTGTAHKLENGRYASSKYVSSFVGFAPVSDPRIVVAVMIDEPSAGQHYGGAVAAPVFREVVSATLRTMSVPPDAPTLNVKLPPADSPVIREEVWIAREESGPKS